MPLSNRTSSSRSGSEHTPSFTCEVPLRVAAAEAHILNVRLEVARQVYNACLGEALRWARRFPKEEARTEGFRAARRAVAFTDAALQRYAVRLRQLAFREHLDVHVVHKLASCAFGAVNGWLLGQRGRPRFKGCRQLDTAEGKSNHAFDPVIAHGLASRVTYTRLVRRKLGRRDRFYTQPVCEGHPYQKPWHRLGEGEVELDIGPPQLRWLGSTLLGLSPSATRWSGSTGPSGACSGSWTVSGGRTTRTISFPTGGWSPARRCGVNPTASAGPRTNRRNSSAGNPPIARRCMANSPTVCRRWAGSQDREALLSRVAAAIRQIGECSSARDLSVDPSPQG